MWQEFTFSSESTGDPNHVLIMTKTVEWHQGMDTEEGEDAEEGGAEGSTMAG